MAYLLTPPTIPLESIQWDATGEEHDPSARLLAHIRIGRLNMHLEAWAVERDEAGVQRALESTMRADDFNSLCLMMDTSFITVEIDGRDYVLVATPYGD